MRTPRREHREVAMVPLAGTCLTPGLTWLAAVDEAVLPGIRLPLERRPCTFVLPLSGQMRYFRPATRGQPAAELHFPPGSLVAHSGGQSWAVAIDGSKPYVSRYLLLNGPLVERIEVDLAALGGVLLDPSPPPPVRLAVQEAVRWCLVRESGWDWQVLSHLAQVAAYVQAVSTRGGADLRERLGRLIDSAPGESWRLAQAAEALGMGTTAFVHTFSSLIGEGPASWIRRRRMDHARRLLALGERPSAVAEALGYPTLAQFSRAFLATVGCRPSVYALRTAPATRSP